MTDHTPLIEIGENVFVASRGVRLIGAEAMNAQGQYERVVIAEIQGQWNRADGISDPDVVRVMLFAPGADRMADGLRLAFDAMTDTSSPPAPTVLDGWLDAARDITRQAHRGGETAALSRLLDDIAQRSGVFLDPTTLRTMAFTLAAIQAAHLTSTDLTPEDPGFAEHLVAALGVFACVVVDRMDGRVS